MWRRRIHEHVVNSDQKPHQFWQHMSTHLLYFRCSIRQLNTKQPLRHFRNEFIVILFYYSILRLSLRVLPPYIYTQPSDIVRAYIFHSLVCTISRVLLTATMPNPHDHTTETTISNRIDAFSINVFPFSSISFYIANEHRIWDEAATNKAEVRRCLQRNQEKLQQTQ